ncbi:acyl-CoA N-acyltransferase [Mycena rebaudengoi]|nr:acyl-CoA N-acyltransferase [Mycena rebaudengoi]
MVLLNACGFNNLLQVWPHRARSPERSRRRVQRHPALPSRNPPASAVLSTHFSTEDARARRLARADDKELVDFNIHALLTESGTPTFAGTTGIFKINTDHASSCEVGILINPAFFRGGLATDALYTVLAYVFEERKLHRAVFQTSVHNAAMCGWLERAGATLEGTEREAWTDGRGGYTDVRLYSVLDREWVPGSVKGNLEARINRAQAGGGSAASGP